MTESNKEVRIKMEDMGEFFKWFFVTSTAIGKDDTEIGEFVNKVVDGGVRNENGELTGEHRIKMSVNGVEVDPYQALSELQKQFNDVVNKRVRMIFENELDEKLKGLSTSIDNFYNEIENAKQEILKKYQ